MSSTPVSSPIKVSTPNAPVKATKATAEKKDKVVKEKVVKEKKVAEKKEEVKAVKEVKEKKVGSRLVAWSEVLHKPCSGCQALISRRGVSATSGRCP